METHHLTAIDMLARGLPAEHVAKKLNVSDRTVRRWKLIPEFAEELRLAMETYRSTLEARYDRIVGKCQVLTDEALEKIALVMRNSLDARICLGAANMLLNHCTRMAKRQSDMANLANAADLEKADKNGRASAAVPLETTPQKRTSPATAPQQPEAAEPVTPVQPMSATGHTGRVGATDAPTAVPSVHPCPDGKPTQKADVNGHRPETPSKSSAKADRPGTDESGIKPPDASVAPNTSQKADENGHPPSGAWVGKGSNHVPFYRGVAGR